MKDKIVIGKKYNSLTVVDEYEDYISPKGYKQKRWLCLCDCGKEAVVYDRQLKTNKVKKSEQKSTRSLA